MPEETDRIQIHDLRLRCIIGTNDWEREQAQDVVINLALDADLQRAGSSDDIADTINYRTITKRIIAHVEASRYHLVEALAESIARLCLEDPRVVRAEVSVEKPGALRFARSVGVTIVRARGGDD